MINIFIDPLESSSALKMCFIFFLFRNVELQACMHKIPTGASKRGSQWPEVWPKRLEKPPYWLKSSEQGVYGKSAPEDFATDYDHWKNVVSRSYMKGFDIDWSSVRNVMDMKAVYGG